MNYLFTDVDLQRYLGQLHPFAQRNVAAMSTTELEEPGAIEVLADYVHLEPVVIDWEGATSSAARPEMVHDKEFGELIEREFEVRTFRVPFTGHSTIFDLNRGSIGGRRIVGSTVTQNGPRSAGMGEPAALKFLTTSIRARELSIDVITAEWSQFKADVEREKSAVEQEVRSWAVGARPAFESYLQDAVAKRSRAKSIDESVEALLRGSA